MAAYAALVSLAQTINQILNHDPCSISPHWRQKIISIHEYVIFLQAFLDDFPEKANTDLEGKIRDRANEAEDIIEYFMWGFASSYGHLSSDLRALKKVSNEIDSIARRVMNIKNSFRIKDMLIVDVSSSSRPDNSSGNYTQQHDTSASSSPSRLAPTHKTKGAVVGFADDLLAIMERLCGESSRLQVIPIVGMGGIGKTTLATNAYHDPLTSEYFDTRAWVTISQDYSAEQVFSRLLLCMELTKTENSEASSESMVEKVYRSLKGRRYLIVMDDVWSTKAWDDIKMVFPNDNNGSRVMLTTRLQDVAAYADSCSPFHEMRFMDADESWNLLKQKVFQYQDCPSELENIGKAIARSCRGLPLAIVVIGGLLSTVNKTPSSWAKIAENVKSAIAAEKGGQFEKILSLSYTHLPHHLRPCFLYMSGFPEDYEIRFSKLVKLWAADGFLKLIESKNSEEVTEEYLEDLAKRSLVLVNRRKSDGQIKSCSIHDLVRDLCIRKAKELKLFHLVDKSVGEHLLPKSIEYQRHIYIAHSDITFPTKMYDSAVRSIICFGNKATSLGSLGNFRLLRTLDMVDANVECFPVEVFKLFRLRYLALCYDKRIPAGISSLQNLQTLIIGPKKAQRNSSLSYLVYLPPEIWRMPRLRHLVSSCSVLLPNLEGATFVLEELVTLSISADLMCSIDIFEMIPNLKKLEIFYSGGKYDNDYHLNDLVHLHQLENLKLNESRFRRGKFDPAFPRVLKKLTLSGWRLNWGEMTRIVGSLPNLQVLKLRNHACDDSKWETNDGEFQQLRYLLIDQSNLKYWITESSHFPRLKCLLVHSCWYLVEIPDGIGEIPTLELIEVERVNESVVKSAKRIQEEQQNWGNNPVEFRHKDTRFNYRFIFEEQMRLYQTKPENQKD